MESKAFGDAGSEVVIEEYLDGFEASILSFFNGKEIVPFISAKDHKKIGDGEKGLNTGGMGVLAPNPQFTKEHYEVFKKEILDTTLEGLLKEELIFSGVIFFGLMITSKGVYLRSEEHTSELQSRGHLVCRLLLEKKKKKVTTSE